MNKISKILIFLTFIISGIYSQTKVLDLIQDGDLLVSGLIVYGKTQFLVTDQGYLPLNTKDPWQAYYRMIYQDSTIINPNTLLNNNSKSNFLFFPAVDIDYQKYYKFPENSKLKEFFGENLKGNIYFLPEKIEEKLKPKKDEKEKK